MKKTTISSLIGLLLSTPAYSATTMINADDVLVSANRIERKDSDATYSSEIHGSDRIKSSGATSLYDYLSQQSSLNILPNYGNKATPSIDMRGYGIENGYQNIVVNVDGRRINNIDLVPPLLGSISLNNIEKIEIVKGTGSVIYGDGATAGVINIYTKSKTGVTIGSSFGSFGSRSSYINAGLSEKYFEISANASNESHDGFSKRDTVGNKDSFDNDTQNIKLKLKPTDTLRFFMDATSSRLNVFYPNSITLASFKNNPRNVRGAHTGQISKTDQWQIGLEFDITELLTFNAFHSVENKLNEFSYGTKPKYDYVNDEVNLKYKGRDIFAVIGLQMFDGIRKSDADETSKKNESYFVHTEYEPNWFLNDLTVSLGGRSEKVKYEYSQENAGNLNANESLSAYDIGINYKLNQKTSLFANYNNGYQAPDIDRFFYTDFSNWPSYTISFNGFIKPSKTKTTNIGIHHNTDNNRLKVSLFRTDLENEIFYYNNAFVGNGLSKNTNIDSSHKYGFELQDAWKINHLLNANLIYTYVKAVIDRDNDLGASVNGNDLPGVPKQTLSLNLNYKYSDNGYININHIWRDSAYAMNDFGNNFSQKQPKYESTNISINYRINKYEVFSSINNLFAKENRLQVQDNAIYPTDFARILRVGFKVDF
jgi:iron complex outermembrane receptor protein